jgi:hypothetical protein
LTDPGLLRQLLLGAAGAAGAGVPCAAHAAANCCAALANIGCSAGTDETDAQTAERGAAAKVIFSSCADIPVVVLAAAACAAPVGPPGGGGAGPCQQAPALALLARMVRAEPSAAAALAALEAYERPKRLLPTLGPLLRPRRPAPEGGRLWAREHEPAAAHDGRGWCRPVELVDGGPYGAEIAAHTSALLLAAALCGAAAAARDAPRVFRIAGAPGLGPAIEDALGSGVQPDCRREAACVSILHSAVAASGLTFPELLRGAPQLVWGLEMSRKRAAGGRDAKDIFGRPATGCGAAEAVLRALGDIKAAAAAGPGAGAAGAKKICRICGGRAVGGAKLKMCSGCCAVILCSQNW